MILMGAQSLNHIGGNIWKKKKKQDYALMHRLHADYNWE